MDDNDEKKMIQAIGIAIRELRVKTGLSQFHLAIQVGISENQLSRIERGESNPTVRTLHKIASHLDVNIADFFK